MPLFGPKKTRTARAATLKRTSAMASLLNATVRNRGILLHMLFCATALSLMLLALEAWRAPYPFRLGDRADHGIVAKVGFHRISRFKTDQVKSEQASQVAPIFRNDPDKLKQLEDLPQLLRNSFSQVAQANDLQAVPRETRLAFGLTAEAAQAMHSEFQTLQSLVSGEDAGPSESIDKLIEEFRRLIAPLLETGVADPAEFDRHNIRASQQIALKPPVAGQPRPLPADVQLPELLKETGRLGRNWGTLSELSPARTFVERWLRSTVQPTLGYQEAETLSERAAARQRVQDIVDRHSAQDLVLVNMADLSVEERNVLRQVTDSYKSGDILLEPGQVVDDELLKVLRAEYDAVERRVAPGQRIARMVTVFSILAVLTVVSGYFIVRNEPRVVRSVRRLAIYLLVVVAAVALGRLLSYDPWRAGVIPVMATVMVLAIAYSQMLAMLTAVSLCLLITLSTRVDLSQFVVLMSVTATAVLPLSHVPSRSTLIKVGFWSGVVYFLVSWGTGILESQSLEEVWADKTLLLYSLRGAGWCLVTGYLVAGSLPFIESAFGVVTDISLLELSDVSHPLLQELVRRAPGTYNHSMAVATIGETAADRIGANGLLVRVGAYFHDIGKMLKPHYFVENMSKGDESRHQNLAPAMSTLIIIGHVKDGVDLARQHNLPPSIIDFIEQHHGTTLVEYFYHEAARQAEGRPDHRADVQESSFRYPGPKPQTREAGVMMLADAVESASRTLSEPTPARIESLVRSITLKKLLDGQFDECPLRLNEIQEIEESLSKSLLAIYHGRIKYPEQKSA
ncbi:MAG TPA: HDIG domain-containing protein [Planctomycetaceae bacterium]|nr:HDIG domain-containing protein [Planctomycetaceae bacterium]